MNIIGNQVPELPITPQAVDSHTNDTYREITNVALNIIGALGGLFAIINLLNLSISCYKNYNEIRCKKRLLDQLNSLNSSSDNFSFIINNGKIEYVTKHSVTKTKTKIITDEDRLQNQISSDTPLVPKGFRDDCIKRSNAAEEVIYIKDKVYSVPLKDPSEFLGDVNHFLNGLKDHSNSMMSSLCQEAILNFSPLMTLQQVLCNGFQTCAKTDKRTINFSIEEENLIKYEVIEQSLVDSNNSSIVARIFINYSTVIYQNGEQELKFYKCNIEVDNNILMQIKQPQQVETKTRSIEKKQVLISDINSEEKTKIEKPYHDIDIGDEAAIQSEQSYSDWINRNFEYCDADQKKNMISALMYYTSSHEYIDGSITKKEDGSIEIQLTLEGRKTCTYTLSEFTKSGWYVKSS